MTAFTIGFICASLGACFGFLIGAMCAAAKKADELRITDIGWRTKPATWTESEWHEFRNRNHRDIL